MKISNNKNNELDEFFKEGFNDFQVPPPSGLKKQEQDPIDKAFQQELSGFESTPSPEVWDRVKTRIPLSLQVKRQLTWWSKVAAALILGLAVTVGLKEYQRHQQEQFVDEPVHKEVIPAIPIESDFVYDLQKSDDKDQKVANRGKSARELLNDEDEPKLDRQSDLSPIAPLETITETVISSTENPLDDKQRSSSKLGDIPLRTQNNTDIESLTLTEKEIKEKQKKKAQENR